MRKELIYACGIAGMAALGLWMAIRRPGAGWRRMWDYEVDDDRAAELITRYRPALEAALGSEAR